MSAKIYVILRYSNPPPIIVCADRAVLSVSDVVLFQSDFVVTCHRAFSHILWFGICVFMLVLFCLAL